MLSIVCVGVGDTSEAPQDVGVIGAAARRGALLRLAAWFDTATEGEAHELAAAAFGMHPARHLSMTAEGAVADVATTSSSWWDAPPAGPAAPRPIGARPSDRDLHRTRLRESSESNARRRRSAAAEIREHIGVPTAAEGQTILELSAEAFELLLELLTSAMPVQGSARVGDSAVDLTLHVEEAPQARLQLVKDGGGLRIEGVRLCADHYVEESAGDD
jgi:hypothetical protein